MAKTSTSPLPTTPDTQTMTAADVYKSVFREYPDVLDVPQVAEILGISVKTVYKLISNGAIKTLKIGRAFRVPKLYLLQYLNVLSSDE